ncbi:MAG: methylmalonyl-CoA mutase subunit beta [Aggregatilineales bacterium]
MTDDHLFSEFEPIDYQTWYDTTVKSLKGKDFETLLMETYEGITLQPMYRREDTADINHQYSAPGDKPYGRGIDADKRGWWIAADLPYRDAAQFNQALQYDMARGQTAVFLDTTRTNASGDNFLVALKGVDTRTTPVLLKSADTGIGAMAVMNMLLEHAYEHCNKQESGLTGYINNDLLALLATTGGLPISIEEALRLSAKPVNWVDEIHPDLKVLMVDTAPYHHAGANAVQELAFALATGAEYIRATLTYEKFVDIDIVASAMGFNFVIGTQFFMEVAKLRAARLLWTQVIAAFGGDENSQKMTIHAQTSRYNKTVADAHTNILRTTLETLAAGVGGAQSLVVSAFDSAYQQPDAFSRRVARNQQLILQQEVNLTKLVDPMGGAWFGETLTDELAKRAWALFQQIEAQGGMVAALQNGFIQQQCAETAAKRLDNMKSGKDVLVGATKYQDETANIPTVSQPPHASVHDYPRIRVSALDIHTLEARFNELVDK